MNELTIELNTSLKKPLYEQIYEYIKSEIQKGILPFDEKLPSTRALANHLQVSRSTIDLAYEQLLSEGYIESIPCKGYFVSKIDELYQIGRLELWKEPEKITKETEYEYDFSPNGIELNSFPYNAWRKLSKNILLDNRNELFQLGEPMGEWSLRSTISKYLYQARGVNCTPERILIGAGNDYLLMLLSRIVGEHTCIAMENPTYKQAYRIFKSMGHKVQIIDMDKHGMQVKALSDTEAEIAYVMPSHQYPLGTVMPIKRRLELLKWAAEKKGRYIIEDDYDSEFRYKGKPIPSLQGYDVNDTVIYVGTFSKSIAPAIRVSYVVLPESLLKIYKNACGFFTSTVSRIDQMIIRDFMTEGYYERHLNKMRAIYKNKHDMLLNIMKEFQDICFVFGENAGLHILARFRNGMTEKELLERAKIQKVRVYALSEYYVEPISEEQSTIIMGYANLEEAEMLEALNRLKSAWKT